MAIALAASADITHSVKLIDQSGSMNCNEHSAVIKTPINTHTTNKVEMQRVRQWYKIVWGQATPTIYSVTKQESKMFSYGNFRSAV